MQWGFVIITTIQNLLLEIRGWFKKEHDEKVSN